MRKDYHDGESLPAQDINEIVSEIENRETKVVPVTDWSEYTDAKTRHIIFATFEPSEDVEPIGEDGDIWIMYEE